MKRLLHDFGGGIAVLELAGEKYLAVRISRERRSFSLTRFTEAKNDPGFIIGEKGRRNWNVTGTCEIDGSIYFYGPYHPGIPLHAYCESPPEDPLPLIRRLGDFFSSLPEGTFPLYANGICIDMEANSVLSLPPRIIALAADEMDAEERKKIGYFRYSQSAGREENLLFFLSAAVYSLSAGGSIEDYADGDDLRSAVQTGGLPPPHYLNPRLKEDYSLFLHSCLLSPAAVSLDAFFRRISEFERLEEPGLSNEVIESRTREYTDFNKFRQKRIGRRNFIRHHGWKLLIIICAGIAIGTVGLRLIRTAMEPPFTAGMSRREVIERFYTAYSELDHETMKRCVAGNAGDELIKKTLNLFVISKIRNAYEGSGSFLAAEEWLENGAPVLEDNPFIFGITDLQIEEKSDSVYIVRYREVLPGRMDSAAEATEIETERRWSPPVMSEVSDRIRFEMLKNSWYIAEIERD